MALLTVESNKTGGFEQIRGSNHRLDVSARSDTRSFYNARDQKQNYNMVWEHTASGTGEYSVYLKSIHKTKSLIITHISLNADNLARLKLWDVSGSAAGDGVIIVGKNTNLMSTNIAEISALHDGGGTPISTISKKGEALGDVALVAHGYGEFLINDSLILGPNSAIAIEMVLGTSTPKIWGMISFFFE